ncbi:MAG: hypothetical protein UT03_C0010G0007 [Candidatus Moranbacteria bacterium GW2011_GWD2_38_7]|nr:MAG: hypothetical protein UT03_C0010G0007 [Candidatus Moranbacteria bacterium GW2011_GWD2_38_7]
MENYQSFLSRTSKQGINIRMLLSSIILSAAIFLILLPNIRTYESTATVLVTSKSEIAALQHAQIVSNIAKIPETLAFYDKLLVANPDVRDLSAGNTQIKRKQFWNGIVNVRRIGKDSVIEISIETVRENDAEKLANKTVKNLVDTAGTYYNNNDVNIHLIEGPITSRVVSDWQWLLILSFILGCTLGFLFQKASPFVWLFIALERKKINEKIKMHFKADEALTKKMDLDDKEEKGAAVQSSESEDLAGQADSAELPQQEEVNTEKQSLEAKELETLNRIIQQDIYPNFPEMPKHAKPMASAPDNLPIADSSFYGQQPELEKQEEIREEQSQAPKEPTPEELKKRLNELLKGKL